MLNFFRATTFSVVRFVVVTTAITLCVSAMVAAKDKVIFDTDTAYFNDDGAALVMLLQRQEQIDLLGVTEVGHRDIVAAGGAQAVGAVAGDQPVADAVFAVLAVFPAAGIAVGADRLPDPVVGLQRQNMVGLGLVAERVIAALADGVFEEHGVRTGRTGKQLHLQYLCGA